MTKSRPVVIIFSILAGLQVLTGAAALGDVIGEELFGIFAILVAAVQVGMTFYVQNMTVPEGDVAAYVNTRGDVVAGPAGGVTNGKLVEIVKTEPPASEGEGSTMMGQPSTYPPNRPGNLGEHGYVDTRTVAVAALIIAVIVVLAIFVF